MLSGLFRRYETTSSNRVDRRLIVPLGSQRALGHLESALFSSPERRVTRRISRPTSFPSRLGGPTWTSRRPTRSGRLRPPWRLRWICYARAFPRLRSAWRNRGSHIFRRPNVRLFTDAAKFFDVRAEEAKRNGNCHLGQAVKREA